MRKQHRFFLFALLLIATSSCKIYRQSIMLDGGEDFTGTSISEDLLSADGNYKIGVNDLLKLQVFTNGGEAIIDPEFELTRDMQNPNNSRRTEPTYLVRESGEVEFPMIGSTLAAGKTLDELREHLQSRYSEFYVKPFVVVENLSFRVVVMGVNGGVVIPIANQNISVAEVLAISGGVGDGKADIIRLVRGSDTFVIDLSTVISFQSTNMIVQPNDIIYVEPVKRPVLDGLRDASFLVSVVGTLTTLLVLVFGRI